MPILHADNIGETVVAANGGLSTLSLSGTAITAQDCRTFAASVTAGGAGNLTDGGTTEINIREVAADGTYNGVWENCESVYTVAGNTVTRGTLLSSSTGSRINFSTTLLKHVFVGVSGKFANSLNADGSPQFAAVNIGHATDTTLTRAAAGRVAVEGDTIATLAAAQTFAGAQEFNNVTITKTAPAISAGVITYALAGSNVFAVSLNANITTSTVTGVGATGKTSSFQVMFTADGTARSVVHPAGIVWADGTAPTMTGTLNKRDWIQYISHDGGTVWFGFVLGKNF